MSEEKMYAVKNDDGEWLRTDTFGTVYWKDEIYDAEWYIDTISARHDANRSGGHMVELVEAPAKVVVSEEEDKMLKKAKNTTVWRPASVIERYAREHERQADDEVLLEDRLMRAYVNGWTVEKPKRWNVKVPHTKDVWYYKSLDGDLLAICPADKKLRGKFTEAEIEHYGLQDCEKVWCDSDD
ncbi:hypothetical protein BVJ53_14145 [Lacticaseibacillus chiayiensis]|uniref:DUF1642 domain-containing protein n=1 Tax=Lacticaseibacillus chiayiensis TaxID=2100821 RepID=A0A4Q1THF0_9LACO|nr:DUF1642 domain-containing protein [Lacticaseibacillus chiayiensis]RXT17759.1 hypothetical protein BVJ53_14145 [Lacticaseibacillus chiayiensis]